MMEGVLAVTKPLAAHHYRKREKQDALAAYMFLLPSFAIFLVFVLIPLILVIYLTFYNYNVITPAKWNNYMNWAYILKDKRLWMTLGNSLKFVCLLVPMHMIFGLLLAFGVNAVKNKLAVYTLRTVYYFPTLLATSSVAIAWTFILNKDFGIINYFLSLVGIGAIPWLSSSFWVFPATMLFSLWKFVGGYFLYFFIGLQGVDRTFLEAAEIDGANTWQKTRHITLPLISPTIFFVFVTMLIGCVQIFDEPYMLTNGGPGDASRTISLYIYNIAFGSHKFGLASAQSIILLVIILLITLIQFRSSNMWVNYDRD